MENCSILCENSVERKRKWEKIIITVRFAQGKLKIEAGIRGLNTAGTRNWNSPLDDFGRLQNGKQFRMYQGVLYYKGMIL